MASGRCVGSISGMVMMFLLGNVLLLLALELVVPEMEGEVPEDGRRLQYYRRNQFFPGLNLLIIFVFWLVVACVSIPGSVLYWNLYIKPTHEKYLPSTVVVPDDLRGDFRYGLCDCGEDGRSCGTCLSFLVCPWCTMGDLWYRAGYAHAVYKSPPPMQDCNGHQFFVACAGCCLLGQVADCFAPCVLAALTSGLGWFNPGHNGGMGSVIPFRTRFGIPTSSETFCSDCCTWCWCFSCQATREYRQINALLERPMQTYDPTGQNVVVGQAVMVQHPNISVAQGKVVESHPPTTSVPHQIDQSNAPTQEVIAA
ncbi:Uncharacterized protein SCF082_LOCUS33678 [Durusdinium trenchii]|uniref:Uncharacterized protein n=1 Tax=Durusdinium trenchii TaxID=1381693 RepID=A0ABP0NQD1_9DINO